LAVELIWTRCEEKIPVPAKNQIVQLIAGYFVMRAITTSWKKYNTFIVTE
jgi:hypothetical protein